MTWFEAMRRLRSQNTLCRLRPPIGAPSVMPCVSLRVGVLAVCVVLCGVTLVLRGGTQSFGLSDPSSGAPSGVAVGGVALSLASPPAPYRVGSPIWIDTEVRNMTSEPIDLMRYMSSAVVNVIDLQTGRALAPSAAWRDCLDVTSSPNWFEIPEGQSHFGALRLDRCFQGLAPGIYSVQVMITMAAGRLITQNWCRDPDYAGIKLVDDLAGVLPLRSPVEWQSAIYEGPPAETTVGPVSHGFALALNVAPTRDDSALRCMRR